MQIKCWLGLSDEWTTCCQGYWSVSMGLLKMQSTVRDLLFIFLVRFDSLQICTVNKNQSPWNDTGVSSKSDVENTVWNRWMQRKQGHPTQAYAYRISLPPFCSDCLRCGLSLVVLPSFVFKVMFRRYPTRTNQLLQCQQAEYRLLFPRIQVSPYK